ncbi:MarR family winged helix-turn-helix transcriptional regulator [Sporolactobacillus putidus]|uniref:MarR family transcriptional regulator n=1 Tax=Sporolactobacillus putidus TaxID=492735 RepID=A0A917S883_9BACL|nr:MarR family transcriptional regulator [Sporolactobacillus putidus]GGL61139.1 MarR family transcriptional regulator [Sporolactobacillus putidus]
MSKLDLMPDGQYVFGAVFVAANRINTMLEKELKKFDVTTKQWFLSIVIDNLFDRPPTIKEAAREMGSSHQNVKQIALKLQQKGFLTLEKDKQDSRAIRLKLTDSSLDFWKKLREEADAFTRTLFKDIDGDELRAARNVIRKMLSNISEMDKINGENGR